MVVRAAINGRRSASGSAATTAWPIRFRSGMSGILQRSPSSDGGSCVDRDRDHHARSGPWTAGSRAICATRRPSPRCRDSTTRSPTLLACCAMRTPRVARQSCRRCFWTRSTTSTSAAIGAGSRSSTFAGAIWWMRTAAGSGDDVYRRTDPPIWQHAPEDDFILLDLRLPGSRGLGSRDIPSETGIRSETCLMAFTALTPSVFTAPPYGSLA